VRRALEQRRSIALAEANGDPRPEHDGCIDPHHPERDHVTVTLSAADNFAELV